MAGDWYSLGAPLAERNQKKSSEQSHGSTNFRARHSMAKLPISGNNLGLICLSTWLPAWKPAVDYGLSSSSGGASAIDCRIWPTTSRSTACLAMRIAEAMARDWAEPWQ